MLRSNAAADAGEELGDVSEGVQRAEVFGLDLRRVGQPLLKRRQDFDALDRVDAEIGVQRHARLQHLHRIARLLRDHRQ